MNFNYKKIYSYGLLVIFIVLIITGFLLALAVNFMHGAFSLRLIKISIINIAALTGGILLNIYIAGKMVRRAHPALILHISVIVIGGILLTGFFYIFLTEPVFFLYSSNLIKSYYLINAIFAFSFSAITSGFVIYQDIVLQKEKLLHEEYMLRMEMEHKLYNAKINPHFLFNSLNLILSLLPRQALAEEAIIKLSDLLRYHLAASEKKFVILSEELDAVRSYLFIQKLRFEKRLAFTITAAVNPVVPPLLILPLVENCIKHNMKSEGHLKISIIISKQDDHILVQVADSAKKLSPDMIGVGSGLSITRKRTELAGGQFQIIDGSVSISLPAGIPDYD